MDIFLELAFIFPGLSPFVPHTTKPFFHYRELFLGSGSSRLVIAQGQISPPFSFLPVATHEYNAWGFCVAPF